MHPFLDAFEAHAAAHPDRPAVGDATRALTRSQLRALAAGLARDLADATDRPHVGILAPCSSIAAVSVLACWYAGRVPVPLNFMLAPAELTAIVADAELDLLLVAEPLAALGAALGTPTLALPLPQRHRPPRSRTPPARPPRTAATSLC